MLLSSVFLILSAIASVASFYYYSREKKFLREFIQQSRRHHHHRELDVAMQKKANRYLLVFFVCIFISATLIIQKVIEIY